MQFQGRAFGAAFLLPLLGAVGATSVRSQGYPAASTRFVCTVASVTDGDTFRCRETEATGREIRVRLSGVSARERDRSCSPGHPCPVASAEAASAELRRLALGQQLQCRLANMTYGRRAAFCRRSDGLDLSCAMVASGAAARWDSHWGRHRC